MIKLRLKLLYLQILTFFKKKRHPFLELCDMLPLHKVKEFKKKPSVVFKTNGYLLNLSYEVTYIDLKICNTINPFVSIQRQLKTSDYKTPDKLIGLINSLIIQIRDKERKAIKANARG